MRPDLDILAGLIPSGSRVLDLGCGDGALLAHLTERHGCSGTGVEIDPGSVVAAVRRGVSVLALDVDRDLDLFGDDSYDVVVLSQTLQVTHRPADVLAQMRRIGLRGVVSVPNFAHWRHRLTVLRGRMPVSRELPHSWHTTPNIHLSTLADLEDLVAGVGLRVARRISLDARHQPVRYGVAANLRAAGAAYLLERA
jgi:methionine biosynthesis protein MetW